MYQALRTAAIRRVLGLRARLSRENGASAVEYGLLVALIAAVIVLVVAALGRNVSSAFDSVNTAI